MVKIQVMECKITVHTTAGDETCSEAEAEAEAVRAPPPINGCRLSPSKQLGLSAHALLQVALDSREV